MYNTKSALTYGIKYTDTASFAVFNVDDTEVASISIYFGLVNEISKSNGVSPLLPVIVD